MRKFLLGTAMAVGLASAGHAQVLPLPPVLANGSVLACVQLSTGEWAWAYQQTNKDGSVSTYPQYVYPNQDVDPDDPYGGDSGDDDYMPTLDTCDPPAGSDQTPVAGDPNGDSDGPGVDPGDPAGDPNVNPGNPNANPGNPNANPANPPTTPSGTPTAGHGSGKSKKKTAANKPLPGPGHTHIFINPNGKIVVSGPNGALVRIGHDIWVNTPGAQQPVLVVDPNDPSKRAIFTPDGKAVGVDPQGHVGVDGSGKTIEPPAGAEKLWLPSDKTADNPGQTTSPGGSSQPSNPDSNPQPFKTTLPRIDDTPHNSDDTHHRVSAKAPHASDNAHEDGGHSMRHTAAKVDKPSTDTHAERFSHKADHAPVRSEGSRMSSGHGFARSGATGMGGHTGLGGFGGFGGGHFMGGLMGGHMGGQMGGHMGGRG